MSENKKDKPQAPQIHPAQLSADALYKESISARRRLKRVQKLLKDVRREAPSPQNYPDWVELNRALDGYEIGAPELDQIREELLIESAKLLKRLSLKTRMTFNKLMEEHAQKNELKLQKVSDIPLVLYADPITFEIDFDRAKARILYGHDLIEESTVDADKLFTLRARALADMKEKSLESAEFFDRLHAAYRMVLAAQGLEEGARVDLVDVMLPLAMLITPQKARRKKGVDALKSYPRHQLAWQLSRLRRDSLLERNEMRLDLGAATGGSTKNKQDVLYIPLGASSGQYYGSIRFIPKNSADAPR